MVEDGILKDQIDPRLTPYKWLIQRTEKIYQTPFLGAIKKAKPRKGRKLRGTIKQANEASRKLRQRVDA